MQSVQFRTVDIDGVNVFYREAGDPGLPGLLLLHGFPSSSHQYRHLMEALSSRFHVIAPDYPGFGNSDMPSPQNYSYTFDNTALVMEKFLEKIAFTRFGLYMQDYGGPVGFRLMNNRYDWIEWLIIQNTNAYEVGFTAAWDELRSRYWKTKSAASEKAIAAFLEEPTVKAVYLTGHPRPELISPDNWQMDLHFLERPGAKQVQLDFFYDYRTNVELYPLWQKLLRKRQPTTLIFWGQGDIFFTPAGGDAYLEDLPWATLHKLDSGHFAIEDNLDFISKTMISFFDANLAK
jgi:pimeloyl-ACP methyl ester carboxylesterase